MSTTTPSERAGKLTAEERERYGELIWDCYRRYDGFSCGWDQLKDYRSESVDNLMDAAEAVIAAFLEDHPRDDAGERGAAIERARQRVIAAAFRYGAFDDLEAVGGCPNCDPDHPADFNATRWELKDALACLHELNKDAAPMPARDWTEGE